MAPVEPGSYESLYRTLAIAQSGVMILTLIITLIVRTTLKKASWDREDSKLADKIAAIEKTLERAGQKSSDLSDDVQGMPERLRTQFVGHDTMRLFIEEMRADRGVLRQDIADLRDRVDNLIRSNKV